MTRKVAIAVSDALLSEVDQVSLEEKMSRSRLFSTAARDWLEQRRKARDVERYLASYREHPETEDEALATDAFLHRALSDES